MSMAEVSNNEKSNVYAETVMIKEGKGIGLLGLAP